MKRMRCEATQPDPAGCFCSVLAWTTNHFVFIHAGQSSGANIQAERMSSSAELFGELQSEGLLDSMPAEMGPLEAKLSLSLQHIIYPSNDLECSTVLCPTLTMMQYLQ